MYPLSYKSEQNENSAVIMLLLQALYDKCAFKYSRTTFIFIGLAHFKQPFNFMSLTNLSRLTQLHECLYTTLLLHSGYCVNSIIYVDF